MPRPSDPEPDVLVLGDHPSAYLAAALLRQKSASIRVVHAPLPDPLPPDRLVLVNPAFFDLHPLVHPLRRKLDLTAVYGLRFLGEKPALASEYRGKSALALVTAFQPLRREIIRLAERAGVLLLRAPDLHIHRLDEQGVDLTLGCRSMRPKAIIVGGVLPQDQARALGLAEPWDAQVIHRYTLTGLPSRTQVEPAGRPLLPMSLDLNDSLCWGGMLAHGSSLQLCLSQPLHDQHDPLETIEAWIALLHQHGILKPPSIRLTQRQLVSAKLPLAGALTGEGVANRTLVIGPAGGFYSACAEDVYPNCWSALFAVEVMRKALHAPHLQDALHPYRHTWRTTLGDYLRGPQQNLRFLLPLVFRNPMMTQRLTEAILLGKSLVR